MRIKVLISGLVFAFVLITYGSAIPGSGSRSNQASEDMRPFAGLVLVRPMCVAYYVDYGNYPLSLSAVFREPYGFLPEGYGLIITEKGELLLNPRQEMAKRYMPGLVPRLDDLNYDSTTGAFDLVQSWELNDNGISCATGVSSHEWLLRIPHRLDRKTYLVTCVASYVPLDREGKRLTREKVSEWLGDSGVMLMTNPYSGEPVRLCFDPSTANPGDILAWQIEFHGRYWLQLAAIGKDEQIIDPIHGLPLAQFVKRVREDSDAFWIE